MNPEFPASRFKILEKEPLKIRENEFKSPGPPPLSIRVNEDGDRFSSSSSLFESSGSDLKIRENDRSLRIRENPAGSRRIRENPAPGDLRILVNPEFPPLKIRENPMSPRRSRPNSSLGSDFSAYK